MTDQQGLTGADPADRPTTPTADDPRDVLALNRLAVDMGLVCPTALEQLRRAS